MSKSNPNDIGIVTIDISNGKVSGPFISPLSSNKGSATKLYIPRFKSMKYNGKLLLSLQKYIGIDKVGLLNKKKWIENAQHLFMNKTAVETFLKTHAKGNIANTKDPNIIKANAEFILREIYFPVNSLFRYKGKTWDIKNITSLSCAYQQQRLLQEKYKNRELQKLTNEYQKLVQEQTKGITDADLKKLLMTQLWEEYGEKLKTLQQEIKNYDEKSSTAANKKIKKALDELKTSLELSLPVFCKIRLDLKEHTGPIFTRKNIKEKFEKFKSSCRKGNYERSAKEREIIQTCRNLCRNKKYSRWCKTCSVLVNCILEPTYPIQDEAEAATLIQAVRRGQLTRKANKKNQPKKSSLKSKNKSGLKPKKRVTFNIGGKKKK